MSDRSDAERAVLGRMDDGWTASNPPTTFVESAIKVALEMAAEATAIERERCFEIVADSVAFAALWVERNTDHSAIAGFAHKAIQVAAAEILVALEGDPE